MSRAVDLDRPPLPDVGTREFQTRACEWLERTVDRVQEPQAAFERLQEARESRGADRSTEIERNVESAGVDLTQQDRERQRVIEQQKEIEMIRRIEQKGLGYSL